MSDGALVDRLDGTVEALLQGGDATAALADTELAPLVRVAADLRHYPDPRFKARLRAHLKGRTVMSAALVSAKRREGFSTITPYVRVKDAGLVDFLARVFGAEETQSMRGSGGGIHREVRIGDSMIMIGEGGADEVMPVRPAVFHIYVPDADASYARALAAGATSLGAPEDRHYGERAGFVRDPFGNHWYIATQLRGSHVPAGVRTVTPFLHLRGAADGIAFLKKAFDATEENRQDAEGTVRYARLRIGDAAIELGEASGMDPMPGAFYLYVGDADLLYHQALAAGATSLWAPADQPYGDRMGAVKDAMDNQWFIAQPL